MRKISFERNYIMHPDGSCLVSFGNTKVICTATVEEGVPSFKKDSGEGWLTAEYSMIPGSTGVRKRRETYKKDGRSTEIQRLIGRSLRACVDLSKLENKTITIDCDVLQADGGTRTASISGAWVALFDALSKVAGKEGKKDAFHYLKGQLAAVSTGIVEGKVVCDLDYKMDSSAEVDMNVVKLGNKLVEVQGTGEEGTFSRQQLDEMLDSADIGIELIYKAQRDILKL